MPPSSLALPYEFDTSSSGRTIVGSALAIFAVWPLAIVKCLVTGQWVASIAVIVVGFMILLLARRIPRSTIRMGAVGRLTATDVVVRPVRLGPVRVPVPVGRFSLSQFTAVSLTERVVVRRSAGSMTNRGSVELVGRGGVPDIELMVAPIDVAEGFARDLSARLGLALQTRVPVGTTSVKLRL